jgi:hypothetical protein
MEQELKSVEQNRTSELVPLPDGHRPITLKWVFKLKKDELGAVIKHKVRLVAHSFVQQEGIDYDDAFTPVACMDSVYVVLVLAAQEGWQVHHMDVKSTFLNGYLKEEVYVRQPPCYAVAREEGKVYHLRKGTLWPALGTTHLEREARRHTQEDGLQAEHMRWRCIGGAADTTFY